jgi:PAS domain S-box-containing protein
MGRADIPENNQYDYPAAQVPGQQSSISPIHTPAHGLLSNPQRGGDEPGGEDQMITVLYVDDEPSLLDAVKLTLEDLGSYRVDTALSAEKGLSMLRSIPYDAIISDYDMPDIDGIEFLRYVRAHHGTIPFILYSGIPKEDVLIDAINGGVNFYLQKGELPASQYAEIAHTLTQVVEHRKAEKALQKSEIRYKTLFDDAVLGLFRITPDGFFLDLNPAFARMCGYDSPRQMKGEVTNIRAHLYVHSDDWDTFREVISNQGELRGFSSEFRRRDNGRIHVRINARTVRDIDGKVLWFDGSCEDITDLLAAQEARDGALAFLREIIANAGEGIIACDTDLTIREWNPVMERLSGYPRSEVLGRSYPDVCSCLMNGKSVHLLHRALEGAVVCSGDLKVVCPQSGNECWVTITYTPRRDGAGEISGIIGLFHDISERIAAEHELLERNDELIAAEEELSENYKELAAHQRDLAASEQRYRTIIENILDVYYRTDREGRLIFVSPSVYSLLGYDSPEDVLGRPNASFWHNPDERQEMLTRIQESGAVRDYEVTLLRKDGQLVEVAASARFYTDDTGEIAGVEGIFRDITERKRAADLIRQQNEDLCAANEELQAILEELKQAQSELCTQNQELKEQEEHLNHSHNALREANRQLNLLSSITRHDILNKITVLNGYLSLIRDEVQGPEALEYLDIIETVTSTIESQIAFTRIYQDLGSQEPQWIPVSTLLETITIPGMITLDPKAGDIEIYTDPICGKVFENLLDNTLRHGGRVTRISVSLTLTPAGLVITWEDDGVGIAAHEKGLIFERGYGKNTGFGLFLVREILQITGIGISEIGEAGVGARFEIHVPVGSFRVKGDS